MDRSKTPLFRAPWVLAAMIALAAWVAGPRAAQAALYGLVVGIDDYIGVRNDLEGAVSDARDIGEALTAAGAREVVLVLNRKATKKRIEKEWDALVDLAKPGDTILFSFAGHGSQEPEPPGRGDEKDGLNENFLLAGYETGGAGSKERIVDDEIFEWLKRADDKDIRVVFVADSCHSGTMHRSAQAKGVKFRNGNFGPLKDDQLTLPSAEIAKLTENDFDNVTFVGATTEDQLTPEVAIDGQKRGALSWAMARALEGRADYNDDGDVTQIELLDYVVPAVRSHVESQQTPQIVPIKARSVALFSVRGLDRERPKTRERLDARSLGIAVEGGRTNALAGIPNVTVVDDRGAADLIWNIGSGEVQHVVGGVVARNVNERKIAPVATKWAALKWLKGKAALTPAKVSLPNGDKRYPKGAQVDVAIAGAKFPYLTMFNLPPDGRVEFFIPDPKRKGEDSKDWRGSTFQEKFRVADPPYGAEHLVAIFSTEILTSLHDALRQMNAAGRAGALRAVLEQKLEGKTFQVGVLDIYTGP